ncbi:MAG: amidase [Hyphomicrobiaceae bacterium]
MPQSSTNLTDLSLTESAAKIRDGEITSRTLIDACLERIADQDKEIGAFAHIDFEAARKAGDGADNERATGNGTGPLHGVPIAVKDIVDTSDMPTEYGSPIFSGHQPTRDASCVAALRNAGAIIIGKTVTTELALLTPSPTRNPVNTNHTPGGSSAGSAAAVGANMVSAAIGSQTAGSVLRPASYCGVVGYKPTFGLISRRGALMQSHTLDTIGVFTRSASDAALLVDCLSAYDPYDPVSYRRSQSNLFDIAESSVPADPIFAFVKTPAWEDHATPDLRAAFEELVETLGPACEVVDPSILEDAIEWQRIVHSAENASYYGPLIDQSPDVTSEGLTERIKVGRQESVTQYIDAIVAREPAYEAIAEYFSRYSAILTPASPGTAPQGLGSTGSPIFNGLWTYLGVPTLSLPLMQVSGMPLGVQLVGPRRDDGRLLRTANWLTQHLKSLDT